MDSKQLVRFKQILLDLRKEVTQKGTDMTVLMGEKVADEVDVASNDNQASLATKFLSRTNSYLKRIDASLKKIDNGTYGECENCGVQISEKRLLVRPIAVLCIDCKEEQEREEKREKDKMKGGFLSDAEWD